MHHFISFLLRIAYAAAFGYILTFHAEDIINYIPQLLGGLLMLETIGQMLELFLLKLKTKVNYGFFIVPLLVLLYALFLIFHQKLGIDENASLREIFQPSAGFSKLTIEMRLAGACLVAFFISEIVISIAFFMPLYRPEKFAEKKAKQEEAKRALEAEQARMAELAAQKEREIAEQKAAEEAQKEQKL